MKKFFIAFSALFAMSLTASATIVPLSHWRMGEEAGDADGRNDSIGGRQLSVNQGPTEFTGDVAPGGSTTAVNARAVNGLAGFFGPDTSSFMPLDNFGVELWVRAANNTQNNNFMVQGNIAPGHLKIGQNAGVWLASYHNVGWIGAANGVGQTATADVWTHLAVVRESGTTSLYIDGVAQAGTTAGTPAWGPSMHLGVAPGGATGWAGDFDEVRMFSFNAGEFDAGADLLFAVAVPEPQSLALVALGGLALFCRRKRAG